MFTAELISKATEINRSARPQKLNFQKNALPLSFATYMEDSDKIKSNATDGIRVSAHGNYRFFWTIGHNYYFGNNFYTYTLCPY